MIEKFKYSLDGMDYDLAIDLSKADSTPDENRAVVLWLNLKSDIIDETIESLTDALADALKKELDADFVARKSDDGWLSFYFYAPHAKRYENIARDIIAKYGNYEYDLGSFRDSKWSLYFDELYPDSYQLISIQNHYIITELIGEGDDLSVPREIEFYMMFQTPTSRERTIKTLEPYGFMLSDTPEGEGDYPYVAVLTIESSLDSDKITQLTNTLYEVSINNHALYEGWSTVLGNS